MRVLMGRLMRQSSPRARAVEVGPVIIRRNGVRILHGTTELAVIESRAPRRRCEMLINIWPGGGRAEQRKDGGKRPSFSVSLPLCPDVTGAASFSVVRLIIPETKVKQDE